MKAEVRQALEDTERNYMEKSRAAMATEKDKSAFYAAYAAGIRRAITEIIMREGRSYDAE